MFSLFESHYPSRAVYSVEYRSLAAIRAGTRIIGPLGFSPNAYLAMDLDFAAFREARWERNSYRKDPPSIVSAVACRTLDSTVAMAVLIFYEYCE